MSTQNKLGLRTLLSAAPLYSAFRAVMVPQRQQTEFINTVMDIQGGERILDIGCGPADIVYSLPPVDYIGFDVSENYIQKAKARHGSKGIFIHQNLTPDMVEDYPPFDLVLALGVLHHLDDETAHLLFETARRALKPAGRLITVDGAYTQPQNPLAKIMLKLDRGEYVRTPAQYSALAQVSFPQVESTIRTDLLRIPYTHCVMSCQF